MNWNKCERSSRVPPYSTLRWYLSAFQGNMDFVEDID
jgi:hypothetical protein